VSDAIFEILSETGNLQVTGSGGIGYGLSATGAVSMVNDGATHPQPMVVAQVSVNGVNPVFAYKANGRICVERTSVSGSTFTFYLRAQSNVAIGVQYWIFDTATTSVKDPTMAGIAAEIRDEYGVVTFDATMAAMRVSEAVETPKSSSSVPYGRVVDLSDTTTITVPAGRTYAIVQSTPAFVFTTYDMGGYSNSENQPNQPIIDPEDGTEPGSGLYRWRQQSLQSYQVTGGYTGGSTIEVGLTRFEYFDLGWQPASSTPFIQVYGQARHLIIDVTNFTSAGGISPTIVTAGVNATSRSVTNGGAETISQSTTPVVTVSASGGTAPYTYLWEFVSGSQDVYGYGTSSASFYTGTNNQPAGSVRSAIYRCRVTDANGYVGYSADVTFSHTAQTYQNDYVPDALALVPLTFVSNEDHASTSDVTDLTGFNQAITLRGQSYDPVGSMDAQAVYFYTGPINQWGPWEHRGTIDPRNGGSYVDFVVQPNTRLHYVIDNVTNSGRKSNYFDLVVWNLSNPGGAAVLSNKRMTMTVDDNNDYNVGDWTPDAISVPNLTGYVSNDPELYTDGRFFQITGVNRQLWLRFIRTYYELSQSGAIFTRRLLVFHSTTGSGGPWTSYFVGAGTPENPTPFTDVACNNGDWFYVQGWITTNSGRGSASWRNYIDYHDGTTVLGRLATFDVSGTVDNDDNYNNADPNLDPMDWADFSVVTNANYAINNHNGQNATGINQAVTLRAYVVNYSGAISDGYLRAYNWNGGNPQLRGDYRYAVNGDGSFAFGVNPGEHIYFSVDGVTGAGRQTANFAVHVYNETTGAWVDAFNVAVDLDQDNNYNYRTPDAFNYGDTSLYTNDPSGNTSTPVAVINGISQAITLRVERYSPSGSMDAIQTYVYRYRPGIDGGWVLMGQFDPRNGGLAYVDFTANNGDQIHYRTDAVTTYGRKDFSQNMVIWNLSDPRGAIQISNNNQTITVDADNNYFPAVDYSPNAISFSSLSGSSFNQSTTVSAGNGTYYLTGFAAPIQTRIYLGYWGHNFQQTAGGNVEVGDGPQSGTLNLDIYRNGQFVGSLTHYLYGSYSGAEQYTWRDDLYFSPNDSISFNLTLTGDMENYSKAYEAYTQGGIYFDNLTVPGERIGSFQHTLSISKPSTGGFG
jgi:hypothetical protein